MRHDVEEYGKMKWWWSRLSVMEMGEEVVLGT